MFDEQVVVDSSEEDEDVGAKKQDAPVVSAAVKGTEGSDVWDDNDPDSVGVVEEADNVGPGGELDDGTLLQQLESTNLLLKQQAA